MQFSANVSLVKEPQTYKQARKDPKWIDAMNAEIEALETNNTWSLIPLSDGKHPVGSKWISNVRCILMVLLIDTKHVL